MNPTHVVVDTWDGYTWAKDGQGRLFTEATARAWCDSHNLPRKPEYRSYRVYRLTLDTQHTAQTPEGATS